ATDMWDKIQNRGALPDSGRKVARVIMLRWRIMLRKNESTPEEVTTTTLTCLVLHNICIAKGDAILATLDVTFNQTTNARKSGEEIRDELHMTEV
ncbi:Hypothetical predicted protein, partial [Paramuricea clavata]